MQQPHLVALHLLLKMEELFQLGRVLLSPPEPLKWIVKANTFIPPLSISILTMVLRNVNHNKEEANLISLRSNKLKQIKKVLTVGTRRLNLTSTYSKYSA